MSSLPPYGLWLPNHIGNKENDVILQLFTCLNNNILYLSFNDEWYVANIDYITKKLPFQVIFAESSMV